MLRHHYQPPQSLISSISPLIYCTIVSPNVSQSNGKQESRPYPMPPTSNQEHSLSRWWHHCHWQSIWSVVRAWTWQSTASREGMTSIWCWCHQHWWRRWYQFTVSPKDCPISVCEIHPTDGCRWWKQPGNFDRRGSSERATQEFRYHYQSLLCTAQARNFCEVFCHQNSKHMLPDLHDGTKHVSKKDQCEPTQKEQKVTNKYLNKIMHHP